MIRSTFKRPSLRDLGMARTTPIKNGKHVENQYIRASAAIRLIAYAKLLVVERKTSKTAVTQCGWAKAAPKLIANSGGPVYEARTTIKPSPKAVLLRDRDYRMAVASLPCFNCGVEGYSQAAHADEGKGLGIKSSDETCYPLCADRPGVVGCHTLIGASGRYSREVRREFEKQGAIWTRVKLGLEVPA